MESPEASPVVAPAPPPRVVEWAQGGPLPRGATFWPTGVPGAGVRLAMAVGLFTLAVGTFAGFVSEVMAGGRDPERLYVGPPAALVLLGLGVAAVRAARRARAARHAVYDGTWRVGVLVLEEGLLIQVDARPDWIPRETVRGRRLRSDTDGGAGVPHPELIVDGANGQLRAIGLPSAALADALAAWAKGAPMARPPGERPAGAPPQRRVPHARARRANTPRRGPPSRPDTSASPS